MSKSAARIREFLQKATRPARRSRVAALLGLVSALLLVSGQGLDNPRSAEKAVSVERNLEVEEAAATLAPSRVRAQSGEASHPTGGESLLPEAPKGSNREGKAAGMKPRQETDRKLDEKSSTKPGRRNVARPDGTGTKSVAAAGSGKGHPAAEAAPYVRAVEISSSPQGGRSGYGIGDLFSAVVTFSEPVAVTGTPKLELQVEKETRQAVYESGTGTSKLVFVYRVAEGDQDGDGVGIEADSLVLDEGTIQDESGTAALPDHEGLEDDRLHRVDGIRPAPAAGKEASVKEDRLLLTFAEALQGSSTPQAEDFEVKVEGKGRDVSEVVLGGRTVRLSLASDVRAGETVTVSYAADTDAEAQPIRDTAGNAAAGFTEQAVANRTGAGGTLPLKTVRQIEALLAKKAQRTPSQRKVSSQLLDAARETPESPTAGAGREAGDTDAPPGLVTVDIRADVTPEVLARIRALGGTLINSVARYRAIRARLPLAAVEKLATLDAIQSIRPADQAVTRDQPTGMPSGARTDAPDATGTRTVNTSEGHVPR